MASEKDAIPDNPNYTTGFFKHDTDRGVLLQDLTTDNLVTAVINLGAQVWIHRRRGLIVEQLLEDKGKVTKEMIEQFVPTAEQTKEWEKERDGFVRSVFAVLARRGDVPINAKLNYDEKAADTDRELLKKFYYY